MNAIQLLIPGAHKKPSGWWICQGPKCSMIHHTQNSAECCCLCSYCGLPVAKPDYIHDECRELRHQEVLYERLVKAQKLESWDSWVSWEDWGSKDGYFESLEDFLDYCVAHEKEVPEYVFVCTEEEFAGVDMSDVESTIEDNGYEDVWADVDGKEELGQALDAFNQLNAGLISYFTDYSRVVSTRGAT